MAASEAKVVIGLETVGFEAGAKRATGALEDIGVAGVTSSRQIAYATRQLPAQFTDIATQLAGGQNPFLILLQQGGQIRDTFGSVGASIKGIASFISPVTVAVGAAAAVFGTLAFAANAGAKEAAQLRDTLTLTGNAAGLTADRVASIGARISAASNQTGSEAREILIALAATGQTSSAALESQAKAIARISDLSGKAGKDIASAFTGQLEAPAKAAAKLNETYNFLSVAEFKRIQSLEQQKKNAEAAVLTNDILTKSFESQKSQLGTVETAVDSLAKAWDRLKASIKSIGAPDTTGDVIKAQADKLAGLRQQLANNATVGRGEAKITGLGSQNDGLRTQIAQAENRLRELARRQDIEGTNADARSLAAAETRAKISELIKPDKAGKDAAALGAIKDPKEQYRADFLASERQFYFDLQEADKKLRELALKDPLGEFINERVLPDTSSRDDKRLQQAEELLQGLRDANARSGAELIIDERTRGLAIIEIDRALGERRIRDAGLVGAALAGALELNTGRAAIGQVALDRQITGRITAAADAASDKLTDGIANGILEGFRRGSSFADIFLNELKAQFAKTVLAPILRPTVDAGNNIISSLLSGITGLLGGGKIPNGLNYELPQFGGVRAAGGPVDAGMSYLVGERGPEVLRMGSRSGNVVPNSALGGTTVTMSPTIYIDSRSDAGQVAQLVAAGMAQAQRGVFEELQKRGVTR